MKRVPSEASRLTISLSRALFRRARDMEDTGRLRAGDADVGPVPESSRPERGSSLPPPTFE
jgi:hypothetical protein